MSNTTSKVTNNSNEMSFHELFSRPDQVHIPIFQREYVWSESQFKRLLSEMDKIVSGEDQTRFLGAIISVARDPDPPNPQPYEIVDGQQRLSTLYLFVLAAAYVAAREGDDAYAVGLLNANLALPWWTSGPNTKLIPSFEDRDQFNAAFNKLLNVGSVKDQLSGKVILPPPTGKNAGRMLAQFDRIRKELQKRVADKKEHGLQHLKDLVLAATTRLTFVFIILKDASNATTVFEGLNDPGIPIGIGDLVRNEVFSKVTTDPAKAAQVHQNQWKPFHARLGDEFDNYFFPFGIVRSSSVTKSDLFKTLREGWKKQSDPASIIADLSEHVDDFNLILGRPTEFEYPKLVTASINKLRRANAPSSTYPFLFHLLRSVRDEGTSPESAADCLSALESFLVRRSISGKEPTGLLVMFRTLWKSMDGNVSADAFLASVQKRGTIDWPKDAEVKESVLTRNIYRSTLKNYLLQEYDRSLGGDVPDEIPWIEHVLPQDLNDQWRTDKSGAEVFSTKLHEQLVHTWGNLIPLSQKMNQGLSSSAYDKKRAAFGDDSMYKSARQLAKKYDSWTAESISDRGKAIGLWASKRWPHQPS